MINRKFNIKIWSTKWKK